jgi:hypothetical protein
MRCLLVKSMTIQSAPGIHRSVTRVSPRLGQKRADETDVVIFVYGDNQFLLEIESLDLPLNLYFIHAGGYWFFRGLSGYVV